VIKKKFESLRQQDYDKKKENRDYLKNLVYSEEFLTNSIGNNALARFIDTEKIMNEEVKIINTQNEDIIHEYIVVSKEEEKNIIQKI